MKRAVALALVALMLVAALPLAVPAATAASVSTPSATLPVPLVGAASVHLGGSTYIFGGREEGGQYSSAVLRYDHATGEISQVASFPTTANAPKPGRYSGAAVAAGGKIYYFGGATLVGVRGLDSSDPDRETDVPRAQREIFEFDPSNNRLRLLLDQLPYAAWGLGGAAASARGSSFVYLFGGFTFDFSDLPNIRRHEEIVRFNVSAPAGTPGRASLISDVLPYAVQDAAVANLNGRLLVMGGLSDHNPDVNPCPTYQFYNPDTQQTEMRQTEVCLTKRIVSFDPGNELVYGVVGELPYRAQFVQAAVAGGAAYIPGGFLADGTAATSIVEVTMNERALATARIITPSLPQGTFGQGVSSDGSIIRVFGGRFGGDRELTDRIVALDPRPTPPWAPRAPLATEMEGGGMHLTWEPPAYNGDAPILGYRIYRSSPTEDERLVGETSGLTWQDTTTRAGGEYVWRITALNSAGESETGVRVGSKAAVTTPGKVASFAAYGSNGEVLLRWLPPLDDGGSNLTGYRVYRNGLLLRNLLPSVLELRDADVINGETYAYRVSAVNAKGSGESSDEIRVSPQPVPPPPSSVDAQAQAEGDMNAVTLTWIPPPESVRRFLVYRATTPGVEGLLVANLSQDETVFVDNLVERGRTYYYSVKSTNEIGESPPSDQVAVSLVRKPGAPSEVTAMGVPGAIRVTWQAPEDLGDAPESAIRYFVARDGRIIRTDIDGLGFTDRTVTPGRQYTYSVSALNPMAGEPSRNVTASALPVSNEPPVAVLNALPAVTTAGAPVELDGSQSSDADINGRVMSYVFDFGDGTQPVTSNAPTVTHAYARNGTFTATLVVKDELGAASEPATAQVVVGETILENPAANLPGGLGDLGSNRVGPASGAPPGSSSGKIPAPGTALVALALVGVALLVGRARRG